MRRTVVSVSVLCLALFPLVGNASGGFSRVICRGECLGHGNTIAGGVCYNQTDFDYVVEVLERNGFRCPAGARDQVVGFQIVDTLTTVDSRCPRVDKVFCEETIVGEYGRYRMDLDSTECFPPQTARSLKKMARAIERGGVHCQRARDSISGVLLEKSGACYRPQAVYCNRPY